MIKITCDQAVHALKSLGTSNPAKNIADRLGADSRAVATALRGAIKDGRVTCSVSKGVTFYRFVRLGKARSGAGATSGSRIGGPKTVANLIKQTSAIHKAQGQTK